MPGVRTKAEAVVRAADGMGRTIIEPRAIYGRDDRFLPPRLAASDASEMLHAMTPRRATRHGILAEPLPDAFAARVQAVESLPRVATGTVLGDGLDLCADASHLAAALPGHAAGHLVVFWRAASACRASD